MHSASGWYCRRRCRLPLGLTRARQSVSALPAAADTKKAYGGTGLGLVRTVLVVPILITFQRFAPVDRS